MKYELLLSLVSSIDWIRHAGELYVIIDPMSSNHSPRLLYLTQGQYTRLVGQVLSNDKTKLTVLATPEDTFESATKALNPPVTPGSKTPESPEPVRRNEPVTGGAAPALTQPVHPQESPGSKPSENTPPERGIPTVHLGKEANSYISPILKRKGIEVKDSMVTPTPENWRSLFSIWGDILIGIIGIKTTPTFTIEISQFAAFLSELHRKNGLGYVILYLKASYLVILAYLGKVPFKSTHGLKACVRLAHGLPAFLPRRWRILIRQRNLPFIRLVLSLLFSYKGINSPHGGPDLATIAAPAWEGDLSEFAEFCNRSLAHFAGLFSWTKWKWPDPEDVPGRLKSSPNDSRSITGRIADWFAWKEFTGGLRAEHWGPLADWIRAMFPRPRDAFKAVEAFIHRSNIAYAVDQGVNVRLPRVLRLGRLATKEEAAGKVRVFALVDSITQYVLSPFHHMLEALLRKFPQDATFDQTGKTADFAARGYTHFWSFDLKSATDLIPQALYVAALTPLIGATAAKAWVHLLTFREFACPGGKRADLEGDSAGILRTYNREGVWTTVLSIDGKIEEHRREEPTDKSEPDEEVWTVRYTRGQPMGAKSSWPSMALVHHMLVKYAAYLAGHSWSFNAYLVLGDDVVIADRDTAAQYQRLASLYGITIGLAKSLPGAEGVFQFANQNYLNGVNISPLSLRHELSCQSPKARASLAAFAQDRWGFRLKFPFIDLISRMCTDRAQREAFLKEVSLGKVGDSVRRLVVSLTAPCGLVASRIGTAQALLIWVISLAGDIPIFAIRPISGSPDWDLEKLIPLPRLGAMVRCVVDAASDTLLSKLYETKDSYFKELGTHSLASGRMGDRKPKHRAMRARDVGGASFATEYSRIGLPVLEEAFGWWDQVIAPMRITWHSSMSMYSPWEFLEKSATLLWAIAQSPKILTVPEMKKCLQHLKPVDNKPFVFKEVEAKFTGGPFRPRTLLRYLAQDGFDPVDHRRRADKARKSRLHVKRHAAQMRNSPRPRARRAQGKGFTRKSA